MRTQRPCQGFIQRGGPRDTPLTYFSPPLKFDNYMYTKHQFIYTNTVSLFTSREPLWPNKTQQQNQRKAKQIIQVEKYIDSNFSPPWQKILYKSLRVMTPLIPPSLPPSNPDCQRERRTPDTGLSSTEHHPLPRHRADHLQRRTHCGE